MSQTEVLFLIGINALAIYPNKEWMMKIVSYAVSGIVTFIIALGWIDSYAGVAIVISFWGIFQVGAAVIMAVEAGGSGKGLSQFKSWWNEVRGKM